MPYISALGEEQIHSAREALDHYRKRVPSVVAENFRGFMDLKPAERFELLFYINAGLSQSVFDIIATLQCPHCTGDDHDIN